MAAETKLWLRITEVYTILRKFYHHKARDLNLLIVDSMNTSDLRSNGIDVQSKAYEEVFKNWDDMKEMPEENFVRLLKDAVEENAGNYPPELRRMSPIRFEDGVTLNPQKKRKPNEIRSCARQLPEGFQHFLTRILSSSSLKGDGLRFQETLIPESFFSAEEKRILNPSDAKKRGAGGELEIFLKEPSGTVQRAGLKKRSNGIDRPLNFVFSNWEAVVSANGLEVLNKIEMWYGRTDSSPCIFMSYSREANSSSVPSAIQWPEQSDNAERSGNAEQSDNAEQYENPHQSENLIVASMSSSSCSKHFFFRAIQTWYTVVARPTVRATVCMGHLR